MNLDHNLDIDLLRSLPPFVLYDAEIIKCIPPKRNDSLDYCEGWDDFANMGISTVGFIKSTGEIGAWDSRFQQLFALQSTLEHPFASAHHVIGFNSEAFDDNLLAANGVTIKTTYDILKEVRMSAYGSPRWEDTPIGYTYSLNALCRANGLEKTGKGEDAPAQWQIGDYTGVIAYCLNDVWIELQILLLGLAGNLIDPNTQDLLTLAPLPDLP